MQDKQMNDITILCCHITMISGRVGIEKEGIWSEITYYGHGVGGCLITQNREMH